MRRRDLLAGFVGLGAFGLIPERGWANVPLPADKIAMPPADTQDHFVKWMQANRGEDPAFLAQRWDRLQALFSHKDIWGAKNIRGFLLTPREKFVTPRNLGQAYVWHYLDIGFGVTITGPHTVARMTSALDVGPGARVLEIGTGSGYHSAYLSNLTGHVFTIEIIPALAARTRRLYDDLIAQGYIEYKSINTKNADGYYGWEEFAPFDRIIVTCGIDHVPPPLLKQLKPDGIMVIPVGPPGAQHVLKILTARGDDGAITTARSDIYGGAPISFVPFTKMEGGRVSGTHNGD
ncbi:MAG TPA: protein-L-isoaspartate O-methyltransferase [Methylovirgula sp.]|nr:protein-L-isoaspartate O-methyltransferase [Methylovirgula sp.]